MKKQSKKISWTSIGSLYFPDAMSFKTANGRRVWSDFDDFYDAWANILMRVDEFIRIRVSAEWHKKPENHIEIHLRYFRNEAATAAQALLDGDLDYRVSAEEPGSAPMKDLLTRDLMLRYRGASMPDFDFLDNSDEEEELSEDELRERIRDDQNAVDVPKIPLEDIVRFSEAKDANSLKDDKTFLALCKEIEANTGLINSVQYMKLKERAVQDELFYRLAVVFSLAAVKAKDVGDEKLARRFVEAKRMVAPEFDWIRKFDPQNAEYVASVFLVDFNELQRALGVAALSDWQTASRKARKRIKELNGRP